MGHCQTRYTHIPPSNVSVSFVDFLQNHCDTIPGILDDSDIPWIEMHGQVGAGIHPKPSNHIVPHESELIYVVIWNSGGVTTYSESFWNRFHNDLIENDGV